MKESLLRIFSFWIISWYILESVLLLLSNLMNWGVFLPIGDEEFSNILSKILVIGMLSLGWPFYMSFITGIFIIGYEGSNTFMIFHHYYWPLYITAFVAFIFTLIMWKNNKVWGIRKHRE